MKRTFLIAATLAALTLALTPPLTSAVAAAQASAVPAKLVGAWNRNVTQANYDKYGLGLGFAVGVWTMVIKKGGGVDFYTPGYRPGCIAKKTCFPDFLTGFAVAGGRLTVAAVPVCATKGTYSWKVGGQSLTLKVIADKQCGPREALFSGVWKRTRL